MSSISTDTSARYRGGSSLFRQWLINRYSNTGHREDLAYSVCGPSTDTSAWYRGTSSLFPINQY